MSGLPPAAWVGAVLVGAGIVLGLWPSFFAMFLQWRDSSTYSYGFLIAPISAWLVWRERARLRTAELRPAFLPLVLALPVLAAWLFGRLLSIEVVHEFAAVAMLVLGLWTVLGHAWARILWFPLCYLFVMVPVGEFLVPYLMRLTADAAVFGVQLSGVPVYQDGFVFSLPSGDFEVIKACSGIRFLMATVAAGLVFAYVAFQSWQRRLWFMALCLIVPVIANLVRAYGIVMIVHLTEMRFAAGGDHVIYGTVFFAAVLVGLFVLAARWAEPPPPSPDPGQAAAPPSAPTGPSLLAPLVVVAVAIGAGRVPAALTDRLLKADAESGTHLPGLPPPPPGWSGPRPGGDAWEPRFAGADREEIGAYQDGTGTRIDVYLASYSSRQQGPDLASSTHRLFQPDRWRPVAPDAEMNFSGGLYRETSLRGTDERGRLVWSWYRLGGQTSVHPLAVKRFELNQLLQGRPEPAGAVVLSAAFESDPEEARRALTAFITAACAGEPDCLLAPLPAEVD